MKDYSAMHDAEINMLVCKRLGLGLSSYCRILSIGDYSILLDDNKTLVDYCNNPADAWPIIQKRGISLNFDGIDWFASDIWTDIRFSNDIENHAGKPLRASMICYLMALDTEKGHG